MTQNRSAAGAAARVPPILARLRHAKPSPPNAVASAGSLAGGKAAPGELLCDRGQARYSAAIASLR